MCFCISALDCNYQGTYKADPQRISRCALFCFVLASPPPLLLSLIIGRQRIRRRAQYWFHSVANFVFVTDCRFMSLGLDVFREEDDQLEMKVILRCWSHSWLPLYFMLHWVSFTWLIYSCSVCPVASRVWDASATIAAWRLCLVEEMGGRVVAELLRLHCYRNQLCDHGVVWLWCRNMRIWGVSVLKKFVDRIYQKVTICKC